MATFDELYATDRISALPGELLEEIFRHVLVNCSLSDLLSYNEAADDDRMPDAVPPVLFTSRLFRKAAKQCLLRKGVTLYAGQWRTEQGYKRLSQASCRILRSTYNLTFSMADLTTLGNIPMLQQIAQFSRDQIALRKVKVLAHTASIFADDAQLPQLPGSVVKILLEKLFRPCRTQWKRAGIMVEFVLHDDMNLPKGVLPEWRNGRFAESWAAEAGYDEALRELLRLGCGHPDQQDLYGRTPLSYACAYGFKRCAELLMQTGRVDMTRKDLGGNSPQDWARVVDQASNTTVSGLTDLLKKYRL